MAKKKDTKTETEKQIKKIVEQLKKYDESKKIDEDGKTTLICQIAIGRIKKGKVKGYLPMEALEISIPSGAIMDALSGGEYGWKDTFDEDYGEYFDEDKK